MTDEKPNNKIQKLLIEASNLQKKGRLEELKQVLQKIIAVDPTYFPAFFYWLKKKAIKHLIRT